MHNFFFELYAKLRASWFSIYEAIDIYQNEKSLWGFHTGSNELLKQTLLLVTLTVTLTVTESASKKGTS